MEKHVVESINKRIEEIDRERKSLLEERNELLQLKSSYQETRGAIDEKNGFINVQKQLPYNAIDDGQQPCTSRSICRSTQVATTQFVEDMEVDDEILDEQLEKKSYRYVPRKKVVQLLYKHYVESLRKDDPARVIVKTLMKDIKNRNMWRQKIETFGLRKKKFEIDLLIEQAVDDRVTETSRKLIIKWLQQAGFSKTVVSLYKAKSTAEANMVAIRKGNRRGPTREEC